MTPADGDTVTDVVGAGAVAVDGDVVVADVETPAADPRESLRPHPIKPGLLPPKAPLPE